MAKVLFVYHNRFEDGYMPLAIASLSGSLKRGGIQTALFDTTFWRDKGDLHLHENRLVREKAGGYKKVAGYNPQREVVDIKQKFWETVNQYRPDLIAVTSTSHEFNSVLELVIPVKKAYNIPVIVGGSHATSVPEKVIRKDGVDFACQGEGEEPLLELTKAIESGADYTNIESIWVKKPNGEIIKNCIKPQYENLDVLPEPDWELFDKKHRIRPFEGELKQYGFFEISRGCPYSCSYCLNAKLHQLTTAGGKKFTFYRYYSPEEVIRRMIKYKEKYGYNHVQFVDENLANMPLHHLRIVAELYKKHIGLSFFTQCRPEAFVAQPEKAKLLAEMGCKMVGIGVESANMELARTVLNRPMREGVQEEAVNILKSAGIGVAAYYIIGFPTETKEMVLQTIELHRRLKPDRFSVRFLHPYPGTPVRDLAIKMGFFSDDFEERDSPDSYFLEPVLDLPSPPHPTKEELMQLREEFTNVVEKDKKLREENLALMEQEKHTDSQGTFSS